MKCAATGRCGFGIAKHSASPCSFERCRNIIAAWSFAVRSLACSASRLASAVSWFSNPTIWRFVFRRLVSSRDDLIPTTSSPATPIVTRTPPVMAQNFCHGNMAAGRLISSQNSTTSWRYSAIKPITTNAVKKNSQNPSASKQFSEALAALSSADKSIDRYERRKNAEAPTQDRTTERR